MTATAAPIRLNSRTAEEWCVGVAVGGGVGGGVGVAVGVGVQFRLAGGGSGSSFWVMFTAEPDCPSGHSKVTTSESESRAMSLFLKVQPWSNPELPVSK